MKNLITIILLISFYFIPAYGGIEDELRSDHSKCAESTGTKLLMATLNKLLIIEIAEGATYQEAAKLVRESDYFQEVFMPVSEAIAIACYRYTKSNN